MQISHSPYGKGPTPEQIASWTRRMSPPENEVPGAVPWSVLLGRSTDAAVALVGARAYSTGIRLDVAVRARHAPRPGDENLLHQKVFGYPGGDGADQLLLGVEYTDGRIAINAGRGSWPPQEQPDDEPSLHVGGGGGDPRGVDAEFFLSPLPPAGPLTIFCEAILRPDPQQ